MLKKRNPNQSLSSDSLSYSFLANQEKYCRIVLYP